MESVNNDIVKLTSDDDLLVCSRYQTSWNTKLQGCY
jgi:hypothetical protein